MVLDPKSLSPLPGTSELQRTEDDSTKAAEIRTAVPLALNLPVFVVQLPYILVAPAKREWIPKGIFPNTWRDLTWPIVGMCFWWFLGRSIEASRRRVS